MNNLTRSFVSLCCALVFGSTLTHSTHLCAQALDGGGGAAAAPGGSQQSVDLAKTMNLLLEIQREFQSIRGQVEASTVLRQESEHVYQDLDLRVSALEDKIDQIHNLIKSMQTTPVVGNKVPSSSPTMGDYEEYQSLLLLINARDYQGAVAGFKGFINKHPKSTYLADAQYWVGESYFYLGDFVRAVAEFQKLYDTYPQHKRVKEGLYKQGLSFMRLKKYPEAKLFFQKVIASYPKTAEAAKASARMLRIEELAPAQLALGSQQTGPEVASPGQGTPQNTQNPSSPTNTSDTPLF